MTTLHRLILAALTLSLTTIAPAVFAAPDTELVSVSAPPLLVRQGATAAQVVSAELNHRGAAGAAELRVGDAVSPIELKEGAQTLEVLVPAVSEARTLAVSVVRGGAVLASGTVSLTPARPWEIRIVHQTHLDIGFTHRQEEVLKVQVQNLRDALRFIEETRDYPEEARFRFHPEGMWAVEEFMRVAADAEKAAFIDACRAGRIHLDVLYAQAMTGMYNDEELVELMGAAKRFEKDYGVPVTSAMQSDVPGYAWGLVSVLAQCGVPYLSVGPNWFAEGGVDDFFKGEAIVGKTHRGGRVFRWADQPFWWEGPSGKDKVLFWMPGWGYSGFQCGRDAITPEKVSAYLNWLEGKNYAYDMVMWRYAVGADNGPAWRKLSDIVRDWNAKYASPRLVVSTNSSTMRDFAERYGDKIPVMRGDFTPYWEDGAASTSKATAATRAAAERLVQAQTLWAMRDPALPLRERFDAAWNKAIMYDEHTWGAHNSISAPDDPFAVGQDKYKQAYAFDSETQSQNLLQDATRPADGALQGVFDVTNTASWARDGLVTADGPGDAVADADGRPVPAQRLASGKLAFVARDVPPMGARRYVVKKGAVHSAGTVKARGLTLSSGLLSLEIDPKTGAICSLRRAGIDGELVDTAKGAGLNEYFFLIGRNTKIIGRDAEKKHQRITGPVKVTVEDAGPVVGTLRIESNAPGCETLVRRVRIVDGLDYVELIDDVNKARERKPEGVYFGFPFDIPGAQARIDTPWAVVRVEQDQLEGANRNYHCVQRWVDLSNAERGVTWVTPDAPMLQFDPIQIAQPFGLEYWREHIEPGAFFWSWTMNNHWETNYKADQEGWITFRYVLRPHAGGYDAVAAQQFGRGVCQPLQVLAANPDKPAAASLLTVGDPGVIVSSVRPSRDGKALIVRLFNTTETPRETTLTWGRPMGAVSISNPMEDIVSPAAPSVALAQYEMVTLRVECM